MILCINLNYNKYRRLGHGLHGLNGLFCLVKGED